MCLMKFLPLLVVLVKSIGIFGQYYPSFAIQTYPENLFHERISNPMSDDLMLHQLNQNEVKFILYSRENRKGIKLNEINIESNIIKGLPLVLITHGWKLNAGSPSVQYIMKGYLENLRMNIIAVDWSSLSWSNYITASQNTRKVGKTVGNLVALLCQKNLSSLNNSHLIGHSLGAHVMGVAGNRIKEITGEKIGRITGLDPAGPLFEYLQTNMKHKLDSSDALFVDIIHTSPLFGYTGPFGDVDFFPNGDVPLQPGCFKYICSHLRSYMYFAESIGNNKAFLSTQCSSFINYLKGLCKDNQKTNMGQWTSLSVRGNYFLTTRSSSPFSK